MSAYNLERLMKSYLAPQISICNCGDDEGTPKIFFALIPRDIVDEEGDLKGAVDQAAELCAERPHEVAELLMKIYDALRLVDHGCSLNGAWASDRGKEAIARSEAIIKAARQ